ncbi:TPA: hypothetical protein ACMFPZ_003242 [Pseudomonas aeruginosa]|uniref:hypothetical protein n=1 Tax=Pseudomonas aeruginosa TaxID=287 RepID=UPI00053E16A0|nr:hypothetical protein [Pseudomonas aeruginosa]HEP9528333.1 hypothetical protein [Pseudomonas aeruginosa]HEP9531076.1 hypothetical protein [Pseudomonas aeruginosa]
MKSLWPEIFSESKIRAPKTILDEQGSFLGKITGGIVDAETVEMTTFDKAKENTAQDFGYHFHIIGRFIDNYRFRLLSFWHDIGMYPFTIKLDSQLAKEMGIAEKFSISTQEEFIDLLESALLTRRVETVVASILSLSK